ncbi:MAG: arabinose transporter [Proteobacteria bacterium]|nr:arabinose transporter [Pseudomonadota bacterium]
MGTQTTAQTSVMALLPIMGVVFIAFLVIGLAMPVLPLHVHHGLGLGTFVVGLVAGSQFAASLVSRVWAGRHADTRGAKHAVITGLLASAVAGLLYLLSLRFAGEPMISVAILLLGRAVLGAGESFVITGAQTWGLALAGARNTGKVLAWMGTAMYAAFALGAPIGTSLYGAYGFMAIALATTLVPLTTVLLAASVRNVTPTPRDRTPISAVIGAVWVPGVGLALSSFGFGAMTAFVSLLFAARGWTVWPAFTSFAVAFILARVLLGHLADRVGGARVALIFVLIEAAGQGLLWAAPWSALALIGAALTGFGYSLVYPAFGVEAVRRAPPQSRGLAMGAYTAFLDLTLGLASPGLGLIGAVAGIGTVFLTSALVVLCAAAIAMRLLHPAISSARRAHGFSS